MANEQHMAISSLATSDGGCRESVCDDNNPTVAVGGRFASLRQQDYAAFYRLFQVLRAEPIFIDIYEPTVFPNYARFTEYFAEEKRPIRIMGPVVAPKAYYVLHDLQREHDLANLDFAFFEGYPTPGSAEALSFWASVRRCLADSGLTRVQSFVLSGSEDKLRLIESLGFHQEGILREHYFHNGKLHDVIIHAWMAEGRGG